jgi:hypothetical protein
VRRTEQFDVINLPPIVTGQALSDQPLANPPAELGQLVDARQIECLTMITH